MKRSIFAPIVLLSFLSSCSRKGRLVISEPTNSKVTGRYALSSFIFGSGVDAEIKLKAKDAYIDLATNGKAYLHNVPVIPDSMNGRFAVKDFRSGSGIFSIAPLGGSGEGNFYGLYLSCGELPYPISNPRFRQKGRLLSLSVEYFDGDFTQRLVFTRTK